MVTLVIASIFITLAVPSYQSMIQRNRMTSSMNAFQGALIYAKSEAITRGVSLSICKRDITGTACDSMRNWDDGWLVYREGNRAGNITGNGIIDTIAADPVDCTAEGDDCILKINDSLDERQMLKGNGHLVNAITFNQQGFLRNNATGTLIFCDARGALDAKAVIISQSGNIIRATDHNGNGIAEDHNGDNLICP
ncbi:MAG: GspH/FimT family pseudopilin [gamma proteobacterium symbiont of Bathyaustriella thionipta]|nr:GspH/FimT family pseudopilin [gamma proteobacterium symbiont of Bathyaustriella thionipta]